MRKTGWLMMSVIAATLLPPQSTEAQSPRIGLFADPAASTCNVLDGPGEFQVFVVLTDHDGAGACDFAVTEGPGFTAIFQGDNPQYPVSTGISTSGISIFFQACETAPTHVLTMNYFGLGSSTACTTLLPVPSPIHDPPRLTVTSCLGVPQPAVGDSITVNPDAGCVCTVPVEENTWGRIKSLYR